MRDKAELEFERVYKKYKGNIKIATINLEQNKKLDSVDIELSSNIVIYLINFAEKGVGTDVDIVNKFNVSRADILNGSFANSFDGFFKYDRNGKLSFMMGLGLIRGRNQDVQIFTPKFVANLRTEDMHLSSLLFAHRSDSKVLYEKVGRKTDNAPKQRPAGIGATKGKVSTFVYIVREVKSISEKSGLPIYGKLKEVSVRRVDQKSADNYVKSMYSYKKTGKLYCVELKSLK